MWWWTTPVVPVLEHLCELGELTHTFNKNAEETEDKGKNPAAFEGRWHTDVMYLEQWHSGRLKSLNTSWPLYYCEEIHFLKETTWEQHINFRWMCQKDLTHTGDQINPTV